MAMTKAGRIDAGRSVSFTDDGTFPNSVLPLLFYEEVLPRSEVTPEAPERLFADNGWPTAWRASVYTFHHYHSTAHETLAVARGSARLMLGGPDGQAFEVKGGRRDRHPGRGGTPAAQFEQRLPRGRLLSARAGLGPARGRTG
jgi:hypothetical protein